MWVWARELKTWLFNRSSKRVVKLRFLSSHSLQRWWRMCCPIFSLLPAPPPEAAVAGYFVLTVVFSWRRMIWCRREDAGDHDLHGRFCPVTFRRAQQTLLLVFPVNTLLRLHLSLYPSFSTHCNCRMCVLICVGHFLCLIRVGWNYKMLPSWKGELLQVMHACSREYWVKRAASAGMFFSCCRQRSYAPLPFW